MPGTTEASLVTYVFPVIGLILSIIFCMSQPIGGWWWAHC
jgi:drug/metabolite transporter (DMT)-like permease